MARGQHPAQVAGRFKGRLALRDEGIDGSIAACHPVKLNSLQQLWARLGNHLLNFRKIRVRAGHRAAVGDAILSRADAGLCLLKKALLQSHAQAPQQILEMAGAGFGV